MGALPVAVGGAGAATIYIGGDEDAKNSQMLQAMEVRAVVDLTGEGGRLERGETAAGHPRLRFGTPYWIDYVDDAIMFMQRQIADGHSVLVHCNRGCKGAGIMAIAYIMRMEGLSLA